MYLPFRRFVVTAGAAIAVGTVGVVPIDSQTSGAPERFRAVAVRLVDLRHTESAALDIVVRRWVTDDECDVLLGLLLDNGPDALLHQLREAPPVGYIRTADGDIDVQLAQSLPASDGGRRIVLAIDRPIDLWGDAGQPPSADSFTLIDLRLNRAGEGEGETLIATKVPDNDEVGWNEHQTYDLEVIPLVVVPSSGS